MSIRVRLTALSTALFLVALTLAGIYVVQTQRASLTDGLDTSLETRADDIVALLERGAVAQSLGINRDEDTVAIVLNDAGQLLTTTDAFGDPNEVIDGFAADNSDFITTSLHTFDETFGTDHMRIYAADGPQGEVIFVGQSLTSIDAAVADLRTTVIVVGLFLGTVVAAATAFTVRRALRPVEAMSAQADRISLTGLDRRLPTARNDELGQLANTFNQMLGRLEEAADTQRRLISDIAHELRSPITSIATQHQVDLAHPRNADWPATAAGVLEETHRLQLLIDNLLLLARLDNDAKPASHELVDLDGVVLAALDRAQERTTIRIAHHGVCAGLVRGDPIQLNQVARNLIDNAVRHADSRIEVSVAESAEHVAVMVSNDGDQIPEVAIGRVFERFFRVDESRDRAKGGAGLGLAISKQLVELHGGSIHVRSDDQGTDFVVRLPTVGDS